MTLTIIVQKKTFGYRTIRSGYSCSVDGKEPVELRTWPLVKAFALGVLHVNPETVIDNQTGFRDQRYSIVSHTVGRVTAKEANV